MTKYYSKVDQLTNGFLWGSVAVGIATAVPIIFADSFWLKFGMLSMLAAFCWLLISVRYNTYYYFKDHFLWWNTGPFRGKIDLNKVSKVSRAKSWMDISAMSKPILSRKCLLVRYSKYDDLPVSPADEEAFIDEMLSINPKIELLVSNASDQHVASTPS